MFGSSAGPGWGNYTGSRALRPPETHHENRDPNQYDTLNYVIFDQWQNDTTLDIWILYGLAGNSTSKGQLADWRLISTGTGIQSLTSNNGVPVFPLAGNINVVGDGTTIVGVGVPGTHTITFSVSGTGVMSSLTGDNAVAVFPLAGNTNLIGTPGNISVIGNAGTHTLQWDLDGSVAQSFPTDSGTATPLAGVLNVLGGTAGRDINTSGAGNTIHVDLNNAITLGDLAVIGVGADALTAITGDISSVIGNLNLGPSNNAGTRGYLTIETFGGGVQIPVLGFPGNNLLMGGNAFALNMVLGTAVANLLIGGGYANITTGRDNTVCSAGGAIALTTGVQNTIVGGSFCGAALTTGSNNILIGHAAASLGGGISGLTTGNNNIIIGTSAGNSYTGAESNNILIGLAPIGVVGESNVTKINNIRGKTTANNNAIAVLIDSAGQLGTTSSSARYKEEIEDMGQDSDVLFKLRPVTFKYKKHPAGSKSVGLIAEEVAVCAPKLVVYDNEGIPETVKYHDLVPMLLNEVIKLRKELDELKK